MSGCFAGGGGGRAVREEQAGRGARKRHGALMWQGWSWRCRRRSCGSSVLLVARMEVVNPSLISAATALPTPGLACVREGVWGGYVWGVVVIRAGTEVDELAGHSFLRRTDVLMVVRRLFSSAQMCVCIISARTHINARMRTDFW